MTDKANNRELKKLAGITDKVRKEMTQTVQEWLWRDWSQRFAEGLLAHGVTISEHKQRPSTRAFVEGAAGVGKGRGGDGPAPSPATPDGTVS